ncbi:uncharacterized protein C19orf44 homolog [Pleuronectes platessa]|uniref:uncharacterized protein C19orf44 homolog n=1 Tax=Pleuronectes platessa TaxID=8262 RepID=UPI00232A4DBB|nr:uncharacterized protein C19orf44 homolog [Pleuronectes platessa]
MWKRGGGCSALDRAEELLSAKRSSRGDAAAEATQRPAPTTPPHTGLRPPSSMGGGGRGGSRFLKKAPPSATNSNQSPVSKSQTQQIPEPRCVSSSQTAALSRLAKIESSLRSRKQVQEKARQLISPPPETTSLPVSVQSSSDQSLNGKRFLKNKAAAGAVDSANTAAASGFPNEPDVGVRSRSRAADAELSLARLEIKSMRVVRGVNLESDEEDMRKLLGDSLESTDNSLLKLGIPTSVRTADKSKSTQKVHSTTPQGAVHPLPPSNAAPPRSPNSPSRHSSPFRFTGQVQAQFSPSVLSPTPSPPRRWNSARRMASPQRSLSSMSGHSEVHSLDELFPVVLGSSDSHGEMSSVSSEDFKIKVMTLDDLVPASFGFTEETPKQEREHKEREEETQEKEEGDIFDYQSDFESESRSQPKHSASQVSEHLQGDRDDVEEALEVREEASNSDVSREKTEDDYSSTFSDTISQTPGCSQTSKSFSRSGDSRSSVSHGRKTSSHQSGRRASERKVFKEAAVQTQPDTMSHTWSTGVAAFDPTTYIKPTPVAAYTLSAETLEAVSTFNPTAFVVNEMLKQQLALTRRFIESSRHLHSSLVQSLEPPNYRYTTLEGTMQYIRKHRCSKPTMEKAVEEV